MNWYYEPNAPAEQLVHPADIRTDPVGAFHAENDRRLPGVKCLPDLGGGRCYRGVGAFYLCADPAQLFSYCPPRRPTPPRRYSPVADAVGHHHVYFCRRELVKKEGWWHGIPDEPAKNRCGKGRKIVQGVDVGVDHYPGMAAPFVHVCPFLH